MFKKIFLIIFLTYMYSCTTTPEPAVDRIAITNFVELVITNTPEQTVDVDLMNAVLGEWLCVQETLLDYTNGYDEYSNVIYLPYVLTNTYDSITNNNQDGAFTFRFNASRYADKIVYTSQGTVLAFYTNAYRYTILSNQYGYRIELELRAEDAQTHYIRPMGPFTVLSTNIEVYTAKTNYQAWFSVTNIFVATNSTVLVVNQTNYWQHYIDREAMVDSFTMQWSQSGSLTNMTWTPDTNLTRILSQQAGSLSRYQENHTIVTTVGDGDASDSSTLDFSLNYADSFILQKIK